MYIASLTDTSRLATMTSPADAPLLIANMFSKGLAVRACAAMPVYAGRDPA